MRVFLLSPASCSSHRARLLAREAADFPLARRLRAGGATLGEVFTFISGLYFRGKRTYAEAFAGPSTPADGAPVSPRAHVITPCLGLLPLDHPMDHELLARFAEVDIQVHDPRYRQPLERDARILLERHGADLEAVLLGSIATDKYVAPLATLFGERLLFPQQFVGRGDMSRGGLLLRAADEGRELAYVPVAQVPRHGPRPPRLEPREEARAPSARRAGRRTTPR